MMTLLASTNTVLQDLSLPLVRVLDLPHLQAHFPSLVYAFLLFLSTHLVFSPLLSAWLFPVSYGRLKGRRARNHWNIHVVSLVHALIIVPLSFWRRNIPALSEDRAFGWDERIGTVSAVASAYFLWDCLDSIIDFTNVGFMMHAVACLAIYGLGFRPFLAYYSPRFLLWELSTIFLDIHWFLDKTGRTGSTLQYVNGIALLASFFGARIVYGWHESWDFAQTIYNVKDKIPLSHLIIYGGGNTMLHVLNLFWFGKMIKALRKRFDGNVQPTVKIANGKSE